MPKKRYGGSSGTTQKGKGTGHGHIGPHKPAPTQVKPVVRPKIICLCGSSRFVDTMAVIAWIFERDEGAITLGLHLLPAWYNPSPDHQAEAEGIVEKMDELHLRKIDLADEIFIVNLDGYIGKSTKREIRYAQKQGKSIKFLEKV